MHYKVFFRDMENFFDVVVERESDAPSREATSFPPNLPRKVYH